MNNDQPQSSASSSEFRNPYTSTPADRELRAERRRRRAENQYPLPPTLNLQNLFPEEPIHMADQQQVQQLRDTLVQQQALIDNLTQATNQQNQNLSAQLHAAQDHANTLQAQVNRSRIQKVIPNPYYGNPGDDFHKWLEDEFAVKAFSNGWTPEEKARQIASALEGSAREIYLEIDPAIKQDWTRLQPELEAKLQQPELARIYECKLNQCHQGPGEAVGAYTARLNALYRGAFPLLIPVPAADGQNPPALVPNPQRDQHLMMLFKKGLRPELAEDLIIVNPRTLETAVNAAVRIEIEKQLTRINRATQQQVAVATPVNPQQAVTTVIPGPNANHPAHSAHALASFELPRANRYVAPTPQVENSRNEENPKAIQKLCSSLLRAVVQETRGNQQTRGGYSGRFNFGSAQGGYRNSRQRNFDRSYWDNPRENRTFNYPPRVNYPPRDSGPQNRGPGQSRNYFGAQGQGFSQNRYGRGGQGYRGSFNN